MEHEFLDVRINYLARVVNVIKKSEKIEVAFIYYGSANGNIHFDDVSIHSPRYKKAALLRLGDEVYADPSDYNKICHFVIHNSLMRLYVRLFRAAKENIRLFFS